MKPREMQDWRRRAQKNKKETRRRRMTQEMSQSGRMLSSQRPRRMRLEVLARDVR